MISSSSPYLPPMNITAPAEVFSSIPRFSINNLIHNSDTIQSNTPTSESDFDLITDRNIFLHFLTSNGMSDAEQLGATPPKNKVKSKGKQRKPPHAHQNASLSNRQNLANSKTNESSCSRALHCCQTNTEKAESNIKRLNDEISKEIKKNNDYIAKRNTRLSNYQGNVVCGARDDVVFSFISKNLAFPNGKVANASIAEYKCIREIVYYKYQNCHTLRGKHCENWLSSVDITTEKTCNQVRHLGKIYTDAYDKFASMDCHNYATETSFKDNYSPEALLLIGAGFGAGGMLGVASLCGVVYLFHKLFFRGESFTLTDFGADVEAQVNRRSIIDPTKNIKKVRTGVGKKKLIKSKIDNKLPPQPSVGVKESNEFEDLFQYENEKKIFPKDESDLYHYVRPVRPPKYVDHAYKETEIETALHQAHHKRVEHLKDQIEEAEENYCAAQLTLKQIKREGNNYELLYSAEKILFEEQQKLKSLETKYAEITHLVKNEEKPREAIHLPPAYEKTNIHRDAYKALESRTKEARDTIIESIIEKNKTSVSNFSNGFTISKTILNQEKILDADIALLSVKEEISETLKKELLEKTKSQLREKIVLGKSDILKENISTSIKNKDDSKQLTQAIFNSLPIIDDNHLKETLKNDILSVAKDTMEINTDNVKTDKAYVANTRMQKIKDILAHNKSLVIKKQQQINLLSPEDPRLTTYQKELKQLKIKSEDENLAMELVKERELKEKEELANTRKILTIGNIKTNIINTVSKETAATITVLPSNEIDITPLALNLELIVNKAMRIRYKQKLHQRENIEKLNAFIENTNDEEKRAKAKELLTEAMSLSNEIAAQRNITLKFMKERDESSVTNEHSLGGTIFNKLYEDKVRRAKKE